jgi:primosomal protein N' (replication factor Y)
VKYVDVLLDEGVGKPLEYHVPEGIVPLSGMRVKVPLRGREVEGWILHTKETPLSPSPPLPLTSLVYPTPLFDKELFKLFQFVAHYYCTPLQKVLRMVIPKGVKENVTMRKKEEAPFYPLEKASFLPVKAKKLTEEQEKVLLSLRDSLVKGGFSAHLLFGVTGSGKTEVYLQLMEKALEMGKGVLFLVPEVALTTQILERLKSRFNEDLSVLHHRLSQGERNAGWQALLHGETRIVIGARSTLFSPIQNLGLIIIDEEHEGAYKQNEEAPCYHARDLALVRGKEAGALVLMGSATPSLESFTRALEGKYALHTLEDRPTKKPLPKINIVDMVREDEKHGGFCLLSDPLIEGIKQRLEKGEQTILFLNRRGHHTSLFCSECQAPIQCPHCTIPITFHRKDGELQCHACGFATPPWRTCPTCKSALLAYKGFGTERVESILHALFPEARILRMDRDTTKQKGSHETLLRAFASGKGDILIGTQMVAKGLNFPQVTLVGILNADQHLHLPDFRTGEMTFQILTQVAGRAGRGEIEGEVVLQTHLKGHPIFNHVISHAYRPFYKEEKEGRKLLNFPPFCRLAKLIIRGENETEVQKTLETLREQLIRELPPSFTIYPVVPCGRSRVRDEHYFQCLLKAANLRPFQDWVAKGQLRPYQKSRNYYLKVDVDPLHLF